MAYRPAYPNQPAHLDEPSFGAELIGVAVFCVLGVVWLGTFALSPIGTVAASVVAALVVWERGTRPALGRNSRAITMRRFALALAALGAVYLFFSV